MAPRKLDDPRPIEGKATALEISRRREAEIKESNARFDAAAKDAEPIPRQMPLFPEEMRVIPNYLARTPLFGAVKPGKRRRVDNEVLASPQGVMIRYSGLQLDYADGDVFFQLVHLGRGKTMGEPLTIVRSQFLTELRRDTGGENYTWLKESLERLQGARLTIEGSRYKVTTNFVLRLEEDKQEKIFQVFLDPAMVDAFGPKEVTFVNWQKRLQIKKQVPLSKWLLSYISSHERGLQQWRLAYLKDLYGYTSPVRQFRPILKEALRQLEDLEIISGWDLYENDTKVRYTRL
ncbi:plasmid replication initiator TrfA [Ralstonia pseudosolanacearum]|uniref:plasmid replication initiator TrfA n=1 Tax=Ralstonia pseudosolanacearum TaxID=1310165 RepID=UPI0006769949|nr:plasmid replication initiator TrfA [Ralstonia pseudosolanacearum]